MTNTQQVTLSEQTVEVLESALTYDQYRSAAAEDGMVTAVVSVDYDLLFERDYDSNLDHVAALVVSELGEDWTIDKMTVVGADPRPAPEGSGQRVLLEVTLWPGSEESLEDGDAWDGVDVATAKATMGTSAWVVVELAVGEELRSLRRRGHRPAVASPVEVIETDVEVALLCTRCDGATQIAFDTATGAVASVEPDGGHNSQDRCAGA